jgi:hypothetical protein
MNPIFTFKNQDPKRGRFLKLVMGFGLVSLAGAAEMPTPEQMWAMIQQQQAQIEELTKRVQANESQTATTETKVLAAVSQVCANGCED